jgi:hypothetical protein
LLIKQTEQMDQIHEKLFADFAVMAAVDGLDMESEEAQQYYTSFITSFFTLIQSASFTQAFNDARRATRTALQWPSWGRSHMILHERFSGLAQCTSLIPALRETALLCERNWLGWMQAFMEHYFVANNRKASGLRFALRLTRALALAGERRQAFDMICYVVSFPAWAQMLMDEHIPFNAIYTASTLYFDYCSHLSAVQFLDACWTECISIEGKQSDTTMILSRVMRDYYMYSDCDEKKFVFFEQYAKNCVSDNFYFNENDYEYGYQSNLDVRNCIALYG